MGRRTRTVVPVSPSLHLFLQADSSATPLKARQLVGVSDGMVHPPRATMQAATIDVLINVFSRLSAKDAGNLALVCKACCAAAKRAAPLYAGQWMAQVPLSTLWQAVSRKQEVLLNSRALGMMFEHRPLGLRVLLYAQLHCNPAVGLIIKDMLSPEGRTQLLFEANEIREERHQRGCWWRQRKSRSPSQPYDPAVVREVIHGLREAGAQDVARCPLAEALDRADVLTLQQLLRDGASAEKQHIAQIVRNAELAQAFLAGRRHMTADKGRALLAASEHGRADVVRLLLAAGANVRVMNDQYCTPLLVASAHGHVEVVRLLLAAGADVDAHMWYFYYSPLTTASERGHVEVVRILLEAGADVNARQCIAIYLASAAGHVEVVRLLLAAGADVRGTYNGMDALPGAASGGHREVVSLLLAAGAYVRSGGDVALWNAFDNRHLDVMQVLLAAGAYADACRTNETMLMSASRWGQPEAVAMLLSAGANVHARGGKALILAADRGHAEAVSLLLAAGADTRARDGEALIRACTHGHVEVASLLLAAGADVHARRNRAFVAASAAGHADLVQVLQVASREVVRMDGRITWRWRCWWWRRQRHAHA